jgi:phage baseplate assembly protein W
MRSIYLPLQFKNGKIATTTDFDTIVKQKIVDILAVSKGERVMRPQYGIGAYGMLYTTIDPLVWADFKQEALLAMSDDISGVTIHDIQISLGDSKQLSEPTAVTITVTYQIPTSQMSSVTLNISDILNEDMYG